MYRYEKNGDLVIDGFENGIATSPHKGIANMQAVNISTETDEVMCSYSRIQQTQANSSATGTLTPSGDTNLTATIGGVNLNPGMWITITVSTITSLTVSNKYYVLQRTGSTITLANNYLGSAVTHGTTGTASFTLVQNVGQPIASCIETYNSSSGTPNYRYYVLDSAGLVWVFDDGLTTSGLTWFLPDFKADYFGSAGTPTGINVLNGWLMVFGGNAIWCKPTDSLGDSTTQNTNWAAFNAGYMNASFGSSVPHYAYVGHQSTLYFTDGNFVGSIFPNSTTATTPNIFSYAKYTSSGTTSTSMTIIGGTAPTAGSAGTRIPAAFFAAPGGSVAAALSVTALYYIEYSRTAGTFQVFAAQSGGSALDITTGASGTQYFNTFRPTGNSAFLVTYVYSPQALTLPFSEISQSITEIGNQVAVGCKSNTIYQWDQISAQPQGFIPLPENNAVNMISVNNMAYVFAGSKGNIYITNGSTASLALTIPDYCAGIAGTPASYYEPFFTWGGAMYLRGRVWFSILDQTSAKTGNCGGIWSFVPTQNFFIGQDTGLSLRMENQNSYGTYNGVATVLLPSQTQTAKAPQYWSGWYSSISNATYGVDFTGGTSSDFVTTAAVIETDLIPIGTMLDKKTDFQIEYKVAAPLVFPESVSISYRQDGTSAYTSCGSAVLENVTTNNTLSGYFSANFEKSQWLQLKVTLTPTSAAPTSSNTFVRLKEIRVR